MELTKKDLKKIKQITISQYQSSKNATEDKRNLFRDRNWLYNMSDVAEEKVRVNTVRGLTNSLLALYYQDKLSIERTSRDLYHFIEASNLQATCEYDYTNLKMDEDDYVNQKNRFLKGVGIRVLTGWDDRKNYKNPTYEVVDPLSRFPDPNGHTSVKNFQFMGFEKIMTVNDIRNRDDWMNTGKVVAGLTPDMQITLQSKQTPRDIYGLEKELGDHSTVVYIHYLRYNNMPVQVIMRGREELLDVRIIEPLVDGGEVDAWIPVSLNYYEPIDGDPRGINLYDIAEDKQKLKTLMMNLIRIQAIKQALGGKIFLDKSIYFKSKKYLEKGVVGPQYIPVDGRNQNISNMMYQEPEKPLSQDVYNFPGMLDNQLESDTGLSSLTRGVADPNADTATEVRTAQMNANINLILGNKINGWGERDFWNLRYKYYKYYFSDSDKKYVELNKGIGQAGDIFSRKNIIGSEDPRLKIANKGELEAKAKSDLIAYERLFQLALQDPNTPPVALRYMKRKLHRMSGMSLREVEETVPYTGEELDAQEQVIMLNSNIPVSVTDMNEDHYTYLVIYQSALSTPATKSAIQARKMAYIQSKQNDKMNEMYSQSQQQMGGMSNIMRQKQPNPMLGEANPVAL